MHRCSLSGTVIAGSTAVVGKREIPIDVVDVAFLIALLIAFYASLVEMWPEEHSEVLTL